MGKTLLYKISKDVAETLELDINHAFRALGARAIANAGAKSLELRTYHGWKDNQTVSKYIREPPTAMNKYGGYIN